MEISALPEFDKDAKEYQRRYRSIENDIELVKQVLRIKPETRPPFSQRIEGLGIKTCLIKVRKMACRALKGRGIQSGFRLVYAWFPDEERIVLLELYFEADRQGEDIDRILKHFK